MGVWEVPERAGPDLGGPGRLGFGATHLLRKVPGRQGKEAGPGLRRGRGRGRAESLLGCRSAAWAAEDGVQCWVKEGFRSWSMVGGDTALWRGTQISLQNPVTRNIQILHAFRLSSIPVLNHEAANLVESMCLTSRISILDLVVHSDPRPSVGIVTQQFLSQKEL